MLSILTSENQSNCDEHIDEIAYAMHKQNVTEFTQPFQMFGFEAREVVENLMRKLADLDALPLSI